LDIKWNYFRSHILSILAGNGPAKALSEPLT
jgi:hypothetical protein